jgi:mannose-1-phosphate guanylyltransferase/mannose-6-phosphate isomerase
LSGVTVAKFVEKPDAPKATDYVRSGYLWNSGNFMFPAALLLEE